MNSWIVQANPQKWLIDWFLDEYIKANPNHEDWWLIEKQYLKDISPGDCVYVWKAKSEPPHNKDKAKDYFLRLKSIARTRLVAGIFAIGEIRTFPKPWRAPLWNDERFRKYRIGCPWKKLTPEDYWVLCTYTENRARNPLLQETIWEKLGQSTKTDLGRFKNGRRGRKLVKLESGEADVINSLLANRKP